MLHIILIPTLCTAQPLPGCKGKPWKHWSKGKVEERVPFKPEYFTRWHLAALGNSLILQECWLEGLSLNEVKQRTKSKASLSPSAAPWQVRLCCPATLGFVPFSKAWGWALPDNCSPLAPRASGGLTHHMGFLSSLISSKKSCFATSGTPGPQLLSFSLTFSWVTGLHKSNLRFLGLSKAAGKPAQSQTLGWAVRALFGRDLYLKYLKYCKIYIIKYVRGAKKINLDRDESVSIS